MCRREYVGFLLSHIPIRSGNAFFFVCSSVQLHSSRKGYWDSPQNPRSRFLALEFFVVRQRCLLVRCFMNMCCLHNKKRFEYSIMTCVSSNVIVLLNTKHVKYKYVYIYICVYIYMHICAQS